MPYNRMGVVSLGNQPRFRVSWDYPGARVTLGKFNGKHRNILRKPCKIGFYQETKDTLLGRAKE